MLLLLLFIFCSSSEQVIHEVFKLPDTINEASALEMAGKTDLIWTLQDHGNKPELYALNSKGGIAHTLKVSGTQNIDWEELSSDDKGNFYIGDFGNNDNDRQDLAIYKIDARHLQQQEAPVSQTTSFYYPEQKEFPPKKPEKIFDAESFFVFNDHFYIFTKNRSSNFDGTTQLYRVPNKPGNHAAQLIGSFQTCDNYKHCAVTGADISPDKTKIALLSADAIWVFSNFKKDDFLSGNARMIPLGHFTQKEGLCFKDNQTIYLCDERDKRTGGYVYRLNIN